MDLVQVTNAAQFDCDAQSDACVPLPPEVSPEGSAVPFTIAKSGTDLTLVFSESAGATAYNVYRGSLLSLAQGIYDHAALPALCGLPDGVVGDASVTATLPSAGIPDGSYLLAVAAGASGESKYGSGTFVPEIPVALNSCP
jgi:hypothetical protein